ncbi:IS5 family insertion sequence transposase domain-containing protein (plasmid) [Sinorhizobium fredii]|uniref:IS5 family insertion sequence transposase domain-containing protein n=1 Tax=Rhizobium fredii TaxID=380 RepID=A0A2L0HB21_RHIFR|nr:IS5 family insertion sequence transposase domain-containing protein [Sinorhizobium fredii]
MSIWRIVVDVIIRCEIGRSSIAPEKLMRAMLLQAFFSIRSERLFMKRLENDLQFRGLSTPALTIRLRTVLCFRRTVTVAGRRNSEKFQGAILAQPEVKALQSTDHFSADGTLIKACALMKSFDADAPWANSRRNAGRNAGSRLHGTRHSNPKRLINVQVFTGRH